MFCNSQQQLLNLIFIFFVYLIFNMNASKLICMQLVQFHFIFSNFSFAFLFIVFLRCYFLFIFLFSNKRFFFFFFSRTINQSITLCIIIKMFEILDFFFFLIQGYLSEKLDYMLSVYQAFGKILKCLI